tara:strand:- start:242 stop:1504 length:1263 start_codon:yes stop_codon:yes gene_type:complete
MINMKVPKEVIDLEKEIEKVRSEKNSVVVAQKFEDAASFRDIEQKLLNKLSKLQKNWKIDEKSNPVTITENDIADMISMVTTIPVNKVAQNEAENLLKMNFELSKKIIGQKKPLEILSKAMQRSRAGLKRKDRPIGVFLFLGPTGVGKTETAKALAKYLFSKDESLIKLDMSEYSEKFTVSRLIGAPPGYVGYDDGGELTEKVRRNPFSVVLFDEIEKAHPDIFNILLQLFDEGRLTDSLGRIIDFKNTIIILTSNIGTKEILGNSSYGFVDEELYNNHKLIEDKIIDKVKDAFNPEFINRLDDCIVYHTLRPEKVIDIIDLQLEDLIENLKELNLSLVVSKKAKRLLSKNGFSLEYGVRFLRREIQNSIENPLSELLLAGKQFKNVAGVKIDVKNNIFTFEPINFKRKKITNKKQIPSS